MNNRKGQIWNMDLIAASTILSVILLLFVLIWNGLVIRWNNGAEYREMYTNAVFASEALLTTSGEPKSWENLDSINESTIHSLGLVNSRNEISIRKIEKLVNSSSTEYEIIKEKLGLTRYEIRLEITDLSENQSYYSFGKLSTALDNSVVLQRFALLNNTPVIVELEVWE